MASGYDSYPQQGFGQGLNLRAKPDAVDQAECIDVLNVAFSDRGAIEQRQGYTALTASALTNRVDSLEGYYTAAGGKAILAGCGTRLEGINPTTGNVIDSETGLAGGPYDFARFGKPNEEVAYAGNGSDTLRKWTGTEWTAPTAAVNGEASKTMPRARYLCVQSPDNRLVATGFATTTGGPNGATSSPSHVYFSEEGNPESWKTLGTAEHPNNSIQLTPGDGEAIQAAIAWKEFVFVFKETKFFIFYGNSTDSAGNPIFSVRTVEAGVGLVSPRAICAHPTGVYFMSRSGIYRTAGQEPEEVSSLVEPIWSGDISAFYLGGVLAHGSISNCAMAIHEDRIRLAFPTNELNSRMLVHDPAAGWWTLEDIPASCMLSFRVSSQPELIFGYASGEKDIGRHSAAYTSDDGAAIKSRWRSGWFDLSSPDVKTIRSTKIWGSGVVGMGIDHDFQISTTAVEEVNMGGSTGSKFGEGAFGGEGYFGDTAAALVGTERRTAVRGTVFSVHLTNETLSQDWSIHRLDHHVRETRKPSTVNA